MNVKSISFIRVLPILLFIAASASGSLAANSEEATLKRVQQARYNKFTGIWQIKLNNEIRDVEAGVKKYLPGLDYTLVDEKIRDAERMSMVFRGQGDMKVVVKLQAFGSFTRISIRFGLFGNENKSAQLFSYFYRRM